METGKLVVKGRVDFAFTVKYEICICSPLLNVNSFNYLVKKKWVAWLRVGYEVDRYSSNLRI